MAGLPTGWAVMPEPSLDADPWTRRARPTFLYVMYAMILWAIPMSLVAAIDPAIAAALGAYLQAIPEPLYTLFGTGYLGYTVMRQWGKVKGKP